MSKAIIEAEIQATINSLVDRGARKDMIAEMLVMLAFEVDGGQARLTSDAI